ncbi:MAG: carboxypeptidase regulatory-like domain-containing protein [Candidatus Acidiferrales bacterium]
MRALISFVGVLVLMICSLPAVPAAHAQGVGDSGSVSGTLTDPSGALIPKGSVTASDTTRGVKLTVSVDANGQYRFSNLPPGTYDITTQIPGFQSVVQKGFVVTVGQAANLDFHLQVATTTSVVEVSAAPPVVETERGSQANTITQNYIEDLPIDRRDYLNFTLLLPGVSDSTRLADDQDFRVKQTPQSGLSFYGSNGRGNSVTVDGGETQDDAGGVRLTVSQDAVQEFQVNRSNYAADLGGATGASVNIVTKSGTNAVHGSAYSYFRNSGMDARDPFAFSQALAPGAVFDPTAPDSTGSPVKNSLARYQFGGNVGFPIHKDKTFAFLAFEGLRQNSENAVPLLTSTDIFRPTANQNAVIGALQTTATMVPCLNNPNGTVLTLPGPACAFELQQALTVSQSTGLTPGQSAINGFLVNELESNGGLFNYNTRQYLFSGRLDHHISEVDSISLSYRYGHDLEENPDVQSLTGFSAGSSIHNYDNNLQAAWYHVFSPRTENEFRFQWDYNSFNVIPNEPGEVGLQIAGFANNLGTNIFLPNFTILRRYDFADNVTMIRGSHTIKFGGNVLFRGNHTESHTFFPGRFVFGALPGFDLSSCLSNPNGPITGNPATSGCGLPGALNSSEINSLQAASLAAPQVYQQGFGEADYPAYSRPLSGIYLQDSWKIWSNFTLNYGIRYEIDSQYRPLNTFYGDIAPRLSFAWDPFKDHKTVVRGGYGIFYGPIDAQIPQVDLSLGVLNKNKSTVENQNNKAQVPDQVNNVVGTCGIGVTAFGPPGVIFPGTGASPCNRYISIYVDPGYSVLPFIQSAGQVFAGLFGTPAPPGNAPGANKISCTIPAPGTSACITPADIANYGIFVQNTGQVSPLTVLFSNPPNYKPPYSQQASLGIEREITPGFSISVSFIYSHTLRLPVAIDTNLLPTTPMSTVTLANGKSVSYRNWNLVPQTDPLFGTEGLPCAATPANPNQPFNCFVNPLIVQNNQYTSASSGLYEGGILEVHKRFSDNFTFFGNYTYSKAFDTGTDFNSDFGPQDPTDLSLDRALSEFDERHKVVLAGVFSGPSHNAFLSGFQLSPIFQYHSGHPFNLLAGGEVNGNNHITNERPIGSPRDTGLGPNYIDFDMRLSWQHKIGERATLQLTAEGFNIANRTNYASVNNEVSPLFGLTPGFTTFNVHGSSALSPSTPLVFTSDFAKREIQLGVRMSF